MLINHNKKFILFTPFKNFSTSLLRYCKQDTNWHYTYGLHPDMDNVGSHTNLYEKQWVNKGYTFFVSIRHPHQRIVSMWQFDMKINNTNYPLTEYLESRITSGNNFISAPVVKTYRFDELIYCENIVSEIKTKMGLNYNWPFPHENKSIQAKYSMTPEEKLLIDKSDHKLDLKYYEC